MNGTDNSSLEALLERAEDYGKTTLELFKLEAVDKLSNTASSVASRVVSMILLLMFFLTGTFALCFWLGDVLGKAWAGFLVVAGFYGLLGFSLYFFLHEWLKKIISNVIIKQILK